MSKYNYSNVPSAEQRQVTITMIVEDGASWAFSYRLTGNQIKRLENYLVRIASEVTNES